MGSYLGKFDIALNAQGYVIAQNKSGMRYYEKKKAPEFVSKTSSGDPAYRDGSYWSYMAQTNWRNGAKQLKWDDPGKSWKSSDVDTSQLEQLTLSNLLVSAGQLSANSKVNVIDSWRAAGSSAFGDGSDSALSISADTTNAPVDSACTGTIGATALTATNTDFSSNVGNPILIIQMTGTGAGNYQKTSIASYVAGTITTSDPLLYTFVSGAQVIVSSQYSSITVDSAKTLTAKAWNGTVGGVIFLESNGATTVTGTITATGKGFRGGNGTGGGQGYQGESTAGTGAATTSANDQGGGGGAQSGSKSGGGGGAGHSAAGTDGQTKATGGTGGTGGSSKGIATLATVFFGGGGGGGSRGGGVTGNPGNGGAGGGFIFLFTKSITVTGAITSNGADGTAGTDEGSGGGGGAGGSVLITTQIGTLGTALITATAGAGGAGGNSAQNGGNGGAGSTGRVHMNYLTSYTGTTSPTIDVAIDSTLTDTAASTVSTAYGGCSDGRIYSWDNATTWTEVFNTRQLEWYETGNDTDKIIGDVGGVETAQAQSFQLDAAMKVKGVQVYLKKNAGTPGAITVTIETNSIDKPSGTLADASATATIPAFTTATYGWITVEFNSNFSLSGTTVYWIVLKTAAAANDQNYAIASDASSPSYSPGTMAVSTNGGTTWAAVTGADAYFRVLGNSTSINCSLVTTVGGTKKIYFGTGNPTGTDNGDARLISYDGTTWVLVKIFTTDSIISSMSEYSETTKVYLGLGGYGRVSETSDFSTFTTSKDFSGDPGYVYALKEYNSNLYAGGGSPEIIPTQYYNGFVHYYNTTKWAKLYPFDFTVIKSFEFYDAYLFMGTYHGHLYVFDSASLNPLFNFKDDYAYQVTIEAMKFFDDKLYIALYPQEGMGDTNVGIWRFDRRGLSLAHTISGVTGYRCFGVINGDLLIGTGDNGYAYKLDTSQYTATGWYQSSYFDANLPSIDKLYSNIVINHNPLTTGQTILVYYKFKEADSWTQLTTGIDNSVGSKTQTLSFATATYSKKISLKVSLNTTTATTAPKLTEVILKYTLYPTRKWQWNMRLKAKKNLALRDQTLETRTAQEIRTDIDGLLSTQSLYAFTDIDATAYTVRVENNSQPNWVINPDDVNENEVQISLLEA